MTLDCTICGIPAQIRIERAEYIEPQGIAAPSADDCYGGWDVEWTVCDRRGRPAPWLERKLAEDRRESCRVQDLVTEYLSDD